MEYRSLGPTGVRVSAVGIGGNQFGGKVSYEDTARIIHAALDQGVNFIDTADVYTQGRSEEALGKALKGHWEQVVLGTKVRAATGSGPNDQGLSRYHIINGVEASLRRLDTDHIDLYQAHSWDERTPQEETLRAFDDLVRSGKVRYIGASNYSAWQLARANTLAEWRGLAQFVTVQPHYHMLHREPEHELAAYCQAFKLGILPYFPLAGGFLTGKYKRGEGAPQGSRGESSKYVQNYMTDANYTKVEKLSAFAQERGHTMAELAIAWLLARPQVCSVISGVTSVEQLSANIQSAAWSLTQEDVTTVDAVLNA